MAFEGTDALLQRTQDFVEDHRRLHLSSGGAAGHLVDMSHAGSPGLTATLLLRTIGRKSGKPHVAPLIYGVFGREWVVVASKGGAPEHPAWYLNLRERDTIDFQVATQALSGRWREPADAERDGVWPYMCGVYPPYRDYETAAGERRIPLVMMLPERAIPPLAE